MIQHLCRRASILAISLALLSIVPLACSPKREGGAPSILHVAAETARVRLLDAASGRPVANADVEVWSDNGIRCVQAPCPTTGRRWTGRTDAIGQVDLPTSALQAVTVVKTPGYEGDLIGESEPAEGEGWNAELFPRDSSDSAPRPIKLIDGRSGRPIADVPVRVEFSTKEGSPDSVSTTSNGLGYVFVPFRVVLAAPEQTWVVVPGYRRTRLDFAWAWHKTKLDRR